LTIHKDAIKIGKYCFKDQKNFIIITVPANLEKIEEGAFCETDKLKTINI
jgi:hypothetical protein